MILFSCKHYSFFAWLVINSIAFVLSGYKLPIELTFFNMFFIIFDFSLLICMMSAETIWIKIKDFELPVNWAEERTHIIKVCLVTSLLIVFITSFSVFFQNFFSVPQTWNSGGIGKMSCFVLMGTFLLIFVSLMKSFVNDKEIVQE